MTQQNKTEQPNNANSKADVVPDEAMAALLADKEQRLSLQVSGLPDEDDGTEREEEELRANQQVAGHEGDLEEAKALGYRERPVCRGRRKPFSYIQLIICTILSAHHCRLCLLYLVHQQVAASH